MTSEDEEFNRIEREAKQRMEAVSAALDKKAKNARELGLDYEVPITMQEGEFDCTHAERLCAELNAAPPVTPCTHPSLGACSLREDGAASRWNCVMCGTEFVPKATNRWAEFNEATKRNIEHAEWYMSTHSNLSQQEPTAWILKCGEQQELWWEKPPFGDAIPIYTTPPQRTWVELTDDERRGVRNSVGYNQFMTAGEYAEHVQKATEAKLREKNL